MLKAFYILFFFHLETSWSNDNLIVIGAPVSLEETQLYYSELIDPKIISVGFGRAIKVTYIIDEVVFGNYNKNKLAFFDFKRGGGFPSYVMEDLLYLFLIKINGRYILSNVGSLVEHKDKLYICGKELNPYSLDSSDISPNYTTIPSCINAVELTKLKKYFSSFNFANEKYKAPTLLNRN